MDCIRSVCVQGEVQVQLMECVAGILRVTSLYYVCVSWEIFSLKMNPQHPRRSSKNLFHVLELISSTDKHHHRNNIYYQD